MGNLGNCNCCNGFSGEYCQGLRGTAIKRWAGWLPLDADPESAVYTTKYLKLKVEVSISIVGDVAGFRAIDSTYTPTGGDYSIGSYEYPYGSGIYVTVYNHGDGSPANWEFYHPTIEATLEQSLTTPAEDAEWHPPGNPIALGNRLTDVYAFPLAALTDVCADLPYDMAWHKLTGEACLATSLIWETTGAIVTDCCDASVTEDTPGQDAIDARPPDPETGSPCPALPDGYDANDANGQNMALNKILLAFGDALPAYTRYDADTDIAVGGLTGTFVTGDNAVKASADIIITYMVTLSDPYTLDHALADCEAMLMSISLSHGREYPLCLGTHTVECSEVGGEEYMADVLLIESPNCADSSDWTFDDDVTGIVASGVRAQRQWFDELTGTPTACGCAGIVVLTKTWLKRTASWKRCTQEQTHSDQFTDALGSASNCEERIAGTDWVSPDVLDAEGIDWGIVTESAWP
jgi:hypothetical protein